MYVNICMYIIITFEFQKCPVRKVGQVLFILILQMEAEDQSL